MRRHLLSSATGALLVALLVLSATSPPVQGGWFGWGNKNEENASGGDSSGRGSEVDYYSESDIDTIAQAEQLGIPFGYTPDMQYNYKFDSQLASSLTEGEQFAVTRMRANVKVQITGEQSSEKSAVIQLEQVRVAVGQLHLGEISLAKQPGMLNMGDMEEVSMASKLQQTLQLPFEAKISSVNGRVKSLHFQQEDQVWSENVKRSVVNLLQVVGARNESSIGQQSNNNNIDNDYSSYGNQSSSSSVHASSSKPFSYKQMEKTIEGDCDLAYTIISGSAKQHRRNSRRQQRAKEGSDERMEEDRDGQEVEQAPIGKGVVTVTKAVDFNKCRKRPELRYNYLRHSEDYTTSNAIEAGQHPYEKEAIDVSSVYEFQVGKPSSQQLTASAANNGDDNDDSTKKGAVVLKAQVFSQLAANILDSDRPALATYAVVKLDLASVEAKPSNEQWSSPSNLKPSAVSLVHSTEQDRLHEQFVTEGNEAYLQPANSAYPTTTNLPAIAVNIMKEMMHSARVGKSKFLDMREEASRHLEHFVNVLRLCNQAQLKEVRQKLAPLVQLTGEQSWKNSKFLRDIFSDALAMACTQQSIAELADLIKDKHISQSKASRAIRHLGHCRVVSEKQLEQLWNICESEQAKAYDPLRQSCLLTYGTMAGAICSSNMVNSTNVWEWEKRQEASGGADVPVHPIGGHSDSDKWARELGVDDKSGKICSSAQRKELVSMLFGIYDNANTKGPQATAEKITAIKTIGNTGFVAALDKLRSIAQSQSEEPLVRLQAIDAFRHLSQHAPRAVQHACLPLFQAKMESEEIRLAAFYQLLHSQPDDSVMEAVCMEMKHESNKHIQAFVQTSIREMAESRRHFDKKTARVLKSALAKLKAYGAYDESAEAHSSSQLHQYSFFSGDFTKTTSKRTHSGTPTEFGAGIITTFVYGKDSAYLPKELSVALDTLFDGRLTGDVYQLSIQQQNGEVAMQKLSEALESKQFDQVVTRTRRSTSNSRSHSSQSSTNSYNPFESLKRFLSKNYPAGSSSSTDSQDQQQGEKGKPKVLISTRSYGQDMGFTLIDEKMVEKFVKDGRFDISALESSKNNTDQQFYHYSASLGPEYKVKVPSVAGVPIVVSKSYPSLYACEGSARMEFEPFRSDKLRGLHFTANMRAQTAASVVNTMEAVSPICTTGVTTRHSHMQKLPLNIDAKLGKATESSQVPIVEVELRLPYKEDLLVKQVSSRPSTFQRVWPSSGQFDNDKYIERSERTLYLPSVEESHAEMRHRYTCPITGLVMETRGHWPRRDPSCANANAHWMVGGENSMELRVLPTQSPLAAGKLKFKFAIQQSLTDSEISGKQKLLALFNNRRELFIDSSEQEKTLVRQFVQEFSPRMNTLTKLRINMDTEQSPQQRSGLVELSTICDKKHYVCTANARAEWKRSGVDGEIDSTALRTTVNGASLANPYQLAIRATGQLACPNLQGVYVGGIRSQHVLAKCDIQVTGSNYTTPMLAGLSTYWRPSAMRVADWQMLLEEAREAGIADYGDSRRRGYIPTVLRANDFAGVWEFQSSTPSKEIMRDNYYRMKSIPQSQINIKPSLEDQLWQRDAQQPAKHSVKIYTRVIIDEVVIGQQQLLLLNMTVSDDPYALVKSRGLKKLGASGEKPKGNHIRVSNQLHGSDDEKLYWDSDEEEGSSPDSSNMKRQKRRGAIGRSRRPSPYDVFSNSDNNNYAECRMDTGRYVKSFDGQSYVIPLVRDCYTIMVKDCSFKNAKPEFEVLAKKVGGPQQERIHVLYNMNHPEQWEQRKYELYLGPTPSKHQHTSGTNSQQQQPLPRMIVKVNGEEVPEEEFEEYSIRVIDPNDGYTSGKKLPKIYIVRCPVTGAEVEFNGVQLRVRFGKRFVNKQCGVCGHYNLDRDDELMMVVGGEGTTATGRQGNNKQQKKIASNLREFHSSYIDKQHSQSGTCDASAVANRIKQDNKQGQQQQRRRQSQSQERSGSMDSAENSDEDDDSYTFRKQLLRSVKSKRSKSNFGVPRYSSSSSSQSSEERGQEGGVEKQKMKKAQKKQQHEQTSEEWINDTTQDSGFFQHFNDKKSRRQQQHTSGEDQPQRDSIDASIHDSEEEEWLEEEPRQRRQSSERDEEDYTMEQGDESREQRQKGQKKQRKAVKPKLATKVIEYQSTVCFSYKPVPTCPAGTQPSISGAKSSQQQKVGFVCLPRHDSQVRKWMRELRQKQPDSSSEEGVSKLPQVDVQRAVKALEGGQFDGQTNEVKRMWVPRECVPAY